MRFGSTLSVFQVRLSSGTMAADSGDDVLSLAGEFPALGDFFGDPPAVLGLTSRTCSRHLATISLAKVATSGSACVFCRLTATPTLVAWSRRAPSANSLGRAADEASSYPQQLLGGLDARLQLL